MEIAPNLVTIDLDESRATTARVKIEPIADALLDAFARGNVRATFFVPRSIAQGKPHLTRRIADSGHEVACLTNAEPAKSKPYCPSFAGELEVTRDAIENATGVRVRGHRNAALALDYGSEWAYDVLLDLGFEYDASRVPPKYVDSGNHPVPKTAHAVRRWRGTLIEVPVPTADVLAMRFRLGASGTIRGWPFPVWSALVNEAKARGETMVVYLRASELRPRTVERAGQIVSRFGFTSVASALSDLYRSAPVIDS